MEASTRVLEVLSRWEKARRDGVTTAPTVLCEGCPELQPAVEAAIQLLLGFAQVAPRPPVAPGQRPPPVHPRYIFQKFLAAGGMGEVWEGFDTNFQQPVAIKILLDGALASEQKRRVMEEASLLRQLERPGIVPVYDIGELSDRRPFFVMKLVQGKTLGQLLKERPHPLHDLDRWLVVFEKICRIVGFAHDDKVLHRDLKPANVMVGDDGEVYVMDWGIGKLQEEGRESSVADEKQPSPVRPSNSEATIATNQDRTLHSQVKGTYVYMAPEQARGESRRISTRSDVFGLGGILCFILTGRPTNEPLPGESAQAMAQRADRAETFARLDASGARHELIALARRCLAAEPEDRPRNGREVADVVENHRLLQQLRASLPPRGPATRQAARYHVVLALLPHAVGASLVTTYSLLWSAFYWPEALSLLAGILVGYTVVSFLVTGVISRLLLAPWLRVWRRLESGSPVTEAETEMARQRALRLPVRSLGLSALGWLPGGFLVPVLLGLGMGTWDGSVFVYFLLAFSIVGLMASMYTALNSNYLIVRFAYPRLWRLPRELPRTVQQELGGVPTRFRLLSALANLVPLATTEAFLIASATLDPELVISPAGRLFLGLAILLVALGMVGTVLAGWIAQYLKKIVDDYFAVLNVTDRRP